MDPAPQASTPLTAPRSPTRQLLRSERRLLIAVLALVVLFNVPYGNYALYPFALFSTWVHESCHAVAAILLGGRVGHIEIFPDTSGLAWTSTDGRIARAGVASAGYVGTAVGGALLLLFRRRPGAGSTGLAIIGGLMLLSAALWLRNGFGFVAVAAMGAALVTAAWRLPKEGAGGLYAFLAATTSLDALTSIKRLFGAAHYVNGEPSTTDARAVGELLLVPWFAWAAGWLALGLLCAWLGLRYPLEERSR